MRVSIMLGFLLFGFLTTQAQVMAKKDSPEAIAFEKEYQKNIKMTKIRGVYIPADIDEALVRLEKLSPPASMQKFSSGEEKMVCKKLHYGLGRWMMENWNFYGGSRLSHAMKSEGVVHPDDMAQFLMRLLHRKLNNSPLDKEALAEELSVARKKITAEILGFETKAHHK